MKSEKLVIIRDYRNERSAKSIATMSVLTASNGRSDENPEKYAIYNKKMIEVYDFAMGIETKTTIAIELYDAGTIK